MLVDTSFRVFHDIGERTRESRMFFKNDFIFRSLKR